MEQQITIDFPPHAVPRYGYGKPPHPELATVIGRGHGAYARRLGDIVATCTDGLAAIARETAGARAPTFFNPYFSGLDAASLYGLLRLLEPGTFLEVGSGHSTRFARRAIKDHGLRTRIVSIDPMPRAEVDVQCDEIIREPFETLDPG